MRSEACICGETRREKDIWVVEEVVIRKKLKKERAVS